MNYTIFEHIVWLSMSNVVFEFLAKRCSYMPAAAWKKRARTRHREIICGLDDIGSIMKNPFRAPLSGGSLWMAVYDTSQGAMDEALFADMVIATLKSPLMRKMYQSQKTFSTGYQLKRKAINEQAQALSDSPFNWHCELILGRDPDEYRMIFTQCGLCALGKKLDHPELIPHMCKIDYLSIDLMGGVLTRTQTLAGGGDCCDFYICKKGSKWDATSAHKAETV